MLKTLIARSVIAMTYPGVPDLSTATPDYDQMGASLREMGFSPLTPETVSNLQPGDQVLFYHEEHPEVQKHYNSMSLEVISEVLPSAHIEFASELENCALSPEEALDGYYTATHQLKFKDFDKYLFRVISKEKIVTDDDAEAVGFRPITRALPEEMPLGSLVLLRNKQSGHICPVIIRVLSHQFENDYRLLFWSQSAIVAGEWHSNVIMDHVNRSFSKYDYLVLD